MEDLITPERAKAFLKQNKIVDAGGLEAALLQGAKILVQEMLKSELDQELGYQKYEVKSKQTANSRNGHSKKSINSAFGKMELRIPRDTDGEFEPTIVGKHERQLSNSIEKIVLALYAKGMSMEDISSYLESTHGVTLSHEAISNLTDRILPLAIRWHNRPLEVIYPILYLDGVVYNVNQDGVIVKKTAYVVYGITIKGMKEILGIWIGEAESSKFWMKVLMDIRNRGVRDVFIVCVDGLSGFINAIESIFPKAEVQKCIVHQIRNATKFVSYRDLKEFCNDMKFIYHAPNETAALAALDEFEKKWGKKYSYAVKSWRENWQSLATFFKYPEEIRRLIYTTNPIEGINRRLRKVTKTKGSFPSDDALFKLLYLVVSDVSRKWSLPMRDWGTIFQQLGCYFGERMEVHMQTA
jgi:transposase-like protein